MPFGPSRAMLAHASRPPTPDSFGLLSSPPHRSGTTHRSGPLAVRWVGCLASRCRRRDTDVHRSPWSLLPHDPERRSRSAARPVQSRRGTGGIAASGAPGRGAHSVAGTASGHEHALPAQPRASPADIPRSRFRSRGLSSAGGKCRSRGGAGGVSDSRNHSHRKSNHLQPGVILSAAKDPLTGGSPA
jgi:hypothetical protein